MAKCVSWSSAASVALLLLAAAVSTSSASSLIGTNHQNQEAAEQPPATPVPPPTLPILWNVSVSELSMPFSLGVVGEATVLAAATSYSYSPEETKCVLSAYSANNGTQRWSVNIESQLFAANQQFVAYVDKEAHVVLADEMGGVVWRAALGDSTAYAIAISPQLNADQITVAVTTKTAIALFRAAANVGGLNGDFTYSDIAVSADSVFAVATTAAGANTWLVSLNATSSEVRYNVTAQSGTLCGVGVDGASVGIVQDLGGALLFDAITGQQIASVGATTADCAVGEGTMWYVEALVMDDAQRAMLKSTLKKALTPKARRELRRKMVRGQNAYPTTLTKYDSTTQVWGYGTGSTMSGVGLDFNGQLVMVDDSDGFVALNMRTGEIMGQHLKLQDYNEPAAPVAGRGILFTVGGIDYTQKMSLIALEPPHGPY